MTTPTTTTTPSHDNATNPSATSFSLCLTTTAVATSSNGAAAGGSKQQQHQQQRKIISISSTATSHDVFIAAQRAFDDEGESSHREIISMRYGFPPKMLDKDNTIIPIHAILSNHERIQVEFSNNHNNNVSSSSGSNNPLSTRQKRANKKDTANKGETIAPSLSSLSAPNDEGPKQTTRQPSQRAAALAAKNGFAATIQAQDEMLLAQQQQESSKRQSKNSNNKKASSSSGKRPRVAAGNKNTNNGNSDHPVGTQSTPSPTTHSNTRYFQRASLEAGRRLVDGTAAVDDAGRSPTRHRLPSRHSERKNRSAAAAETWKSEDDVSVALMSALNQSGGGGGKVGSILRKAMSNAVSQSYEASRAVVRVAAVTGHAYTILPTGTSQTSSSAGTIQQQPEKLHVTYDKGVEGRGYLDETVDFIPKEALVAVITAIYQSNPEALRPARLAQLSPRVLWSLIYHTTTTTTSSSSTTTTSDTPLPTTAVSSISSVEAALHALIPQLDWAYMRNRKRTLSEKAKENLRQQLEEEKIAAGNNDDDQAAEQDGETEEGLQRAQETILAVQNAMETIHDWDSQQRRNRIAQATMARLGAAERHGNSNDTTDRSTADDDATNQWRLVTPTEPDDDELVACIKPTATDLFGSNEANDVVDTKIHQIVHALMNGCQIHNWRELANASVPNVTERLTATLQSSSAVTSDIGRSVSAQVVAAWIDYAQAESVDEIIVEICDGCVNVVEQLRDAAHTGTPKDLAAWRHIPQLLWTEARLDQVVDVSTTNNDSQESSPVTVETLATWCRRAHQVLQEWEWIQSYATPIE